MPMTNPVNLSFPNIEIQSYLKPDDARSFLKIKTLSQENYKKTEQHNWKSIGTRACFSW
jgi:hypothetical protein